MSLYRITPDKFEPIAATTFAAEGVLERKHLQSLLRKDISPLGDDLIVIAEEYGQWEDSGRRIDLLCVSKEGDLVVVEIKRTEDGGHMELQAVRYAAMVSGMTFDQVVNSLSQTAKVDEGLARATLLDFFDADPGQELTGDVRIVLVSANFSTELTTTVLWLNQLGLDITCVRLRPYRMGSDVLIDATQIIPLPEAKDYVVKMRAQENEKKKVLTARQEAFAKYWVQMIERSKQKTQLLAGRTSASASWLSAGFGRAGFFLNSSLTRNDGKVECYIQMSGGAEMNKKAFKGLLARKEEIEASFGSALDWQELPERAACRICTILPGGWSSPESEWPAMQDRMIDALIRLEASLRKPIQELKF